MSFVSAHTKHLTTWVLNQM